ncbi:hemagglutinin repeat-containing protein [Dyella sp.]|uniref:hemagglutinin repeat-containing protein n=1 Tax=Dyella sp. TaxID=1869338 RepID=UPI002D78F739|nr:hemagglutinin repeat-containing protein [Dyella sp.]HET7329512.1 hemagglutinin repeat-containing protein [Dyella sp.]
MVIRRHASNFASTLPRRALSTAVLSALLATPLLTRAQVTPDPNAGAHRPGVDTAANGVPVVNIVAPSAAGVSHNQYQQFNVDRQGLILNNAAGVSQTQLGGYIAGNPHYQAGQSARLIVNEVTSSNLTYLRGYTEVAGNAADVVVANPNGISVAGGGFINTPRATLTTGVPVFGGDGSLQALRVARGAISIDGDGLNASNIDRLDLISRSLVASGKLWANQLNVVAGANQVGYADLSTQRIAGEGDAPAVGIDVAALDGMYAHAVRLMATDAGVGVRNAGELASQSGDFAIDASGRLQLTGATSAAGNLTIKGDSLSHSGILQSGGAMTVQTAGDASNSGTLSSGGRLSMAVHTLSNSGVLQSAGNAIVQSTGDVSNTGTLYSNSDLTLGASGLLGNSGVIAAANNLGLTAQQVNSSGTLGAGIGGDGSLQGAGALNVAARDQLAANGRNLAAGSITLQGGALNLSSAQTQAGSDVALIATSGGIDHRNATLAARGALAVRSAGDVDNSQGAMQAARLDAQALAWRNAYGSVQTSGAIHAQIGGLLDNTQGTWVSGGDMALRTGLLANTGTLYAGGGASFSIADALTSAGTLAAQGDLVIAAGSVDSRGTLAAGLQGDGTLSGTAQLDVTTQGVLAATGKNAASGALQLSGGALDLHGATTRAGGDIRLGATQGGIDHTSGDLATEGHLSVQAAQAFNNAHGRLQAGGLAVQAGALTNRGGSLLQTGGGDTTLAVNGLLENDQGTIATNGSHLTLAAATLDNTGGAIRHAGTGTLSLRADTLTNRQGQIVGNGDLLINSARLANIGGTLSVAGHGTLFGGDWDNTGGTVVARQWQAQLTGTLSNRGGLLQADSARIVADTLSNGDGQIKALDGVLDVSVAQTLENDTGGFLGSNQSVNLTAGGLNNAGQIYAGTDLTLSTQGDATNSGAWQALGSISVNAGGALMNDGGRLEAGNGQGSASLTLSAASLSNRGGRIANADNGNTAITSSTATNEGGTLGGQGDVMVNVARFDNTSGTIVAGRNLNLQSAYLGNRSGTLYSAGDIGWINSGATLDNTGGSIGAGGDIALTLDTVHNQGGDIAANGNVASQFNTFDGTGRLRAGNNLALTLAGDYTNAVGNTLFANGDFTFRVGGAFVNASGATLQSVGALTLDATRLDNQAGATINSRATTLNATTQTNAGRIEGDAVMLNGGDVSNVGTVIGNAVTVNATHLTNGADLGAATDNTPYQTALIAAVNTLNLYVTGTVLNRDAMLYTLGDLTIAADADGTRSQSVTNLSGSIEAEGDIAIATQQFTNQRRVLDTDTHVLTAAEQAQNTQATTVTVTGATDPTLYAYCASIYVPHQYGCSVPGDINNGELDRVSGHITTIDTVTAITRLTAASAESRLLASGTITLNGSVLNDNSSIAAGQNLIINGQDGQAGGGSVGSDSVINRAFVPTATVHTTVERWADMRHKSGDNGGSWHGDPPLLFDTATGDVTLAASAIPFLGLDPGPALAARMTAGGQVDISGHDISNTQVDADGRPVSGVGLGSNGSASWLSGQAGGGIGSVGGNAGAIGPLPGAQFVGTPQQPYPVQLPSNGLYTIKPGSGSPYLVETDPRFASYTGFLGSDYLMSRLGLDGDLTLKRLGDAFYETQLVMDQLTRLTGRRFLDGTGDTLAQYKALMDAGVDEARQFNLAVGVALSADQVAHLTQDMVWLVNEQVNGESVLVPVVYLSQKTADSVASGAVIQGTTVNLNASQQLTHTGTLQASQDASLKAGNLLNAGNLAAGGNLSVQTAHDLLNVGTVRGGNVQLVAGHDLVSSANAQDIHLGSVNLGHLALVDAQRLGVASGGQITAIGNLTAEAGHHLTLDHATLQAGNHLGLAAGQDLTATASTLQAGAHAQLIAGNNLNLQADQHTVYGGTPQNVQMQTVHDLTTVNAGGTAVLAAGHDLTSQGAQLTAGDQLALSAGHDITLNAVADHRIAQHATQQGRTHTATLSTDETLRGTRVDATNGVAISAGHDLTTVAANITSTNGGMALAAGNDIHLNAGQENHTWQQDSTTKTSGFLSSTTKTAHDASQDSLAVGTVLSGNTVTVAAGHDITTQAAQIVATNDVVMAAGNNLALGTATSTHSEQHDRTTKTSGVFTSGLNLMIGSSKESQSYSATDTTPQGSVVGSLNGGVTLTAGNNVHITGSDVLSNTGTAIVGKNVTIDAAVGTQDTTQSYKQQQAGLTLGLGGAVANAVNSAYASAERGSQVSDDRLKALYAAQAAYSASDALGFAQGGVLNGATKDNPQSQQGVTLQLGIGASSANSTTTTHDETAYGSHIRSNGDVTIAATGGDLTLIGSQIDGQNVALAAANNLNILSQQENHSLQSSNKNASGGIGIQIGSDGVGFYAQGSVGKGSAHGNGTMHAESLINASDTLTLVSGNDTTIKGAQLTGNTVIGAIGGNLLIQSEQDTDDYASKQQQLGGKLVIGYGSGGSVSYNQSKVNSHYRSVNEVSGIQAGSGGFDITVGGNTHLVGGVIASSADPSKNLLNTGSLTYENIHNEANYSASSVGISGGYGAGSSMAGNVLSGVGAALSLATPQYGQSSSDTNAGIAQGTIHVRDGNADLSGLDRHPTLDNQALNPIFDAQKVQENMELGNVAGQVGMRSAGTLAQYMANHAATPEEQAAWSDGGANKTLLHGLVGAATAALGGGNTLQGALGAAASEAASGAMQHYLDAQGITDPNQRNLLMQLASTAIGGAIGGGVGAATALQGDQYNRTLHPEYVQRIDKAAQQFAQEQCNAGNCISVDEARNRLIYQAYRNQDATFDQVQAAQGRPNDQAASDFLSIRSSGYLDPLTGQPIDLSSADASERQNPALFANALYNDKQAYDWVKQATGLSDDYLQAMARQDYYGNQLPAYADQYASWRSNETLMELSSFYGKIALAGGTGGLLAGGTPFLLSASAARESVTSSTLLQYMLTTRTGVGVASGAIDAASQLIQKKPDESFYWTNVGMSVLTGYLGVGGGLGWNTALNASGGAVQAQLNNWIYGQNNNVLYSGLNSGIAGAAGYGFGGFATSGLNKQFQNSLTPVIGGNAASSTASEAVGTFMNNFQESVRQKNDSKINGEGR